MINPIMLCVLEFQTFAVLNDFEMGNLRDLDLLLGEEGWNSDVQALH
jgi:hypothetical protein